MNQKYVYVVFASTPYRMGMLIRKLSGNFYNHVSIALDENLEEMYSFARRNYHYPLYGGFVRESHARYHANGKSAQIKVCRLPVSLQQHQALTEQMQSMYENRDHFLYNHLSIFGTPFHRTVPVKDAYICIEFVVHVLSLLGFPVTDRRFYTIRDLETILENYTYYTGFMREGGEDPAFYERRPVPHPIFATIASFFALFPRLECVKKP